MDYLLGVFRPPVWVYFIVTIGMIQFTFAGITLYLHRDQTHRGIDLHPAVRHVFRFWLWMSSGMLTKEWVAVHRKHHAFCETKDDPHSPKIEGLRKVLLEGAELYRIEKNNPETLEKYGRGTPDDWMERNVYVGKPYLGVLMMLAVDVILFGPIGLTIFACQMAATPVFAAGVINGIGHHTGYRNFECDDAATNIVPWGFIVAGEELHNNHHAFPSSAKFSIRRWEFDLGWMYIRILKFFGLVEIRRVAPTPEISSDSQVDLETLRAVIVNRMHVLRDYAKLVTVPVLRSEIKKTSSERVARVWRRGKRLLLRRPELLDAEARARLDKILAENAALKTVHEFREKLRKIWTGATVSNERLLAQLKDWCTQAEGSGIRVLQEFSERVKSYSMSPVPA